MCIPTEVILFAQGQLYKEEVLEQDEAQAKITLLENAVHGFQESDTVTLSEVIGMEGLAGSEAGVNG